MQTETLDEWFERIYVNFPREIVFVYPVKLNKGPATIWKLKDARDYVKYLEQEEKTRVIV